MKFTFAKVFNLPSHQVLVTKEQDQEDEYKVVVKTAQVEGELKLSYVFDSEEGRDLYFMSFNLKAAQDFLKSVDLI